MNTGEACENKCEWFHDSNSSAYTLKCLDITGIWGHCTPFTRKKKPTKSLSRIFLSFLQLQKLSEIHIRI